MQQRAISASTVGTPTTAFTMMLIVSDHLVPLSLICCFLALLVHFQRFRRKRDYSSNIQSFTSSFMNLIWFMVNNLSIFKVNLC